MDLRHVLWIGGATGAGKSSIARALAYGNDLQLYNVDLRTSEHVERSPPGAFASLSQAARYALGLTRRRDRDSRVVGRAILRSLRELEDLSLHFRNPGLTTSHGRRRHAVHEA